MSHYEHTRAKPFVKWAGGKRQLLPAIEQRLPKKFNNYFEPFVGGGALFFKLAPKNATVNDINAALVNTYNQIKNEPEDVMSFLDIYDRQHALASEQKTYYYSVREEFNEALLTSEFDARAAALLIYINKHCFNGLYRVNSKGLFNVPFNGSKRASYSKENLSAASSALKNITILQGDFEDAVKEARAGDFVFFDSPYVPLNPTSFESYTKEGFSKDEHERLARLFKKLSNSGCYCMLTNHDTEFIRELYDGFIIEQINVRRSINSDATKRTGVEVIIRNYS